MGFAVGFGCLYSNWLPEHWRLFDLVFNETFPHRFAPFYLEAWGF